MLKINLLNILSEPVAINKCNQLNTLLESSNIKDLYSYIEYIINFIFSNSQIKSIINIHDRFPDTINTNNKVHSTSVTSALYSSNWPLKIINRSQHNLDYECMFSFLCTSSIFWSSIFKLDAYGAVFRLPISSFPTFIKTRIENPSSYLFSKIDAHYNLNLTPIEYYFVFFFMFVHEGQTQSRKVYNEQNDCIELDSVYGDLLIDYLNFFLPINKKNIDFPSSTQTSNSYKLCFQNNTTSSSAHHSHHDCQSSSHKHTHLSEYPCLFKRSFKKTSSLTQFENDLTKSDSIQNAEYKETLERTNDFKKIDTFLRLINEILVYPFTWTQSISNSSLTNSPTKTTLKRNNNINKSFEANNSLLLSNVQFSSPIKYNDTMQNLTSIENVFTLSMIIKHSQCFSNAFQAENPFLPRNHNDNESCSTKNFVATSSASLAELRQYIFKIYWCKSLYKFFQYNLENWRFDSSIKWLIELWLIYIQPQPQQQQQKQKLSNYSYNLKQNESFESLAKYDFCRDNFFIYSDIYEILIKRYSIVDLTNFDNLQLVHKILSLYVDNKDIIIKCDLKLSQIQTQWFQNFANINKINKHEYQHFIRHNSDYGYFINLFQEFERPINTFRPLISVDNIKTVSHFYESLTCAKTILNEHLNKKNQVSQFSWFKSWFMADNDHNGNDGQLSKINEQDLTRTIVSIDQCLELIKLFYENKASFEDSELLMSNKEISTSEQQVPISSETLQSSTFKEKKVNEHKLSQKERFKIINGLKKPAIVQIYDPERAPIGDFENKFLVYLARFVSDLINENYSQAIENVYYKEGKIGRLSKKIFYLPQRNGSKPKIELRSIASYKFIFYFLVYLLLLNILTGYSLLILIPLVLFIFFFNFILKN